MPRFPMCPGHMDLGEAASSSVSTLPDYIGDRELVAVARRTVFPRDFVPCAAQCRFPGYVAFGRRMHARQVDPVCVRQGRFKKLGAADDKSLVYTSRHRSRASDGQRFFQRGRRANAGTCSQATLPRLKTIESRPSRGLPIASKVLRPMISGWPMVSFRKRRRSLPSRHGSLPWHPITPLSAIATMRESMNSWLVVKPRLAP